MNKLLVPLPSMYLSLHTCGPTDPSAASADLFVLASIRHLSGTLLTIQKSFPTAGLVKASTISLKPLWAQGIGSHA